MTDAPSSYSPVPSLEKLQQLALKDMGEVNKLILATVDQRVPLITQISQHIVQSGGKRIRPHLTIGCAHLLGYEGVHHVTLATAVELIHTATLLHDDVVDESTMRRGLQTANTIWSNQASVLVGDFLLSRAFQLMVTSGSLEVLQILSDASATISQGEVTQLMAAGDLETNRELYLEIISAKTATLFSAACEVAPVIAGQSHLRESFRQFGLYLGIAFQIVDDALDYTASSNTLGKAVGDDFREGKITLPVIEAYRLGNAEEKAFWQRVIGEGDYHEADLAHAISLIQQHQTIETAFTLAQDYIAKANELLDLINGHVSARHALQDCLQFCVSRIY